MPATQIESFCERCGTKYAFEQPVQRARMLKGLGRTLGFLPEEEAAESSAAAARDPFHGLFRFCLECRQYTCPNCWNDAAGFCQGCVPLAESPDMGHAEAFAAMEAASHVRDALAEIRTLGSADSWPNADLPQAEVEAEPLVPAAAEPEAVTEALPEPLAAAAAGVVLDDDLFAGPWNAEDPYADAASNEAETPEEWSALMPPEVAVEPVAAEVTAEPQPILAAPEPESEPEAVIAAEPEPQVVANAEPEPASMAAVAEPEPEMVAVAAPEPEPLAAPAKPEPESMAALAELEPMAMAESEPMAALAEPEPQMVAVAEPKLEPMAAAAEPEPEPEPEPIAATAEPEPEPIVEPVREPLPSWELPMAAIVAEPEPETQLPLPMAATPAVEPYRPLPLVVRPTAAPAPVPAPAPEPQMPMAASAAESATPPTPIASMPSQPAALTPANVPASRLAALFGRGQKPAPEPPQPNEPRLAAGWRVTAPDDTVWSPRAPVYQPPASGANGAMPARPSLLGPRPGASAGAPSGIRPCYQCALPLSASARFCRRCGSAQQPGA